MPDTQKLTTDIPHWLLLNQAPTATSAISCTCTQDDGNNRYIYYVVGSAFFRYDTQGDVWQQLANPNIAPTVLATMRYTGNRGYHCRVISATSNTIRLPGLRGRTLHGKTIRLERGTGLSQSRVLTYVGENIHDAGVITGTSATTLVDSTKKWKINQWAGYNVGITFGTNVTQYKKILYNDTTTLFIADANLQPHDPWNNQQFGANSPYALPVTTAGSQAHFQILSHDYTVDSDWTVTPDYTTYATVLTGGIYLLTVGGLQYYDILHDQWQTKTFPGSLFTSALATDITMERLSRSGSAFESGTASSGTSRTLTDSTKTWTRFQFANNYRLLITGGTGAGQHRRIVNNSVSTITVNRPWSITPDNTSTYQVWADYDKILVAGNACAGINAYSPENDCWTSGQYFDDGICGNVTVSMNGWTPVAISTGIRQTNGITAVNSTPTAGGSGYSIGDILTVSTGGTGGQVIVESVSATGAVTGISLIACGTTYTVGTGRATTGGTGTGCTIEITAVGTNCRITTATAHWFKTGDVVTVAGCNSAGYNTSYTILGVNGTTTFDVATSEAANMFASNTQSTTVIVDASKNWTVNEHVGKLVHLMVAGTAPTSQIRWITANTATTLTVATITAGVNGTSKYTIYDAKTYGSDDLYKASGRENFGFATGGSTTTLIDSTKSWVPNQWAGYKMRIEGGTGFASGIITITSNTNNTLTYATQSFTPDATTHYEIADSWGLMTAGSTTSITETGTKNWPVNRWAGKRVRITAGTGAGQEATITSNTATVLTTGTITLPDATSVYSIQGIPARGTGIELMWAWGSTFNRGRYVYLPRGSGSNTLDIYDLVEDRWIYGTFLSSQQESFSTGSMYAYDGVDSIFMHKDATGRIFKYHLINNDVEGGYQLADTHGAALIGNRMEIIDAPGGEASYLYLMQHTGTKMWRVKLNVEEV